MSLRLRTGVRTRRAPAAPGGDRPKPAGDAQARQTAWRPFRHRVFRALWIAQLASNVGTWMHVVGAQWLMGDLGGGAFAVALVQTATSLPVFLFALPAGAMGDLFDRRRVLLASQTSMLVAATVLGVLTLTGATTRAVLLGLTFTLGTGQALMVTSWQAIQPELVDRDEIPQAAALNGVNFNLARAIGPAIGGVLVAASGPATVFLVNAASFLAVGGVLLGWRRPPDHHGFARERMWGAVALGARFVRSAPTFRIVLLRMGLFIAFASALWALLPVVARGPLALGSGGYGLLFASVGIGAGGGAFLLPVLRSRLSPNALVAWGSLAFAVGCLGLGLVRSVPVVVAALALSGLAWIAVISSLNATAQTLLPAWARARAFAYYTLTFMSGQALGSVVWGALADRTSTRLALVVVAAGLVLGALAARRWPLVAIDIDLRPAGHFSEPQLVLEPGPRAGPVTVTVEYRVPEENAERFEAAMSFVERVRRRTGATRWNLLRDGAEAGRYLEVYGVPTWEEHLRQHEERVTVRDRELERRALDLVAEGTEPRVSHYFPAIEG